ncbi:hypothetical protein CK203_098177 [Vitis vinifera]|uniref:Uncharacterized protein n=1 Tax=Vitis vinifera TaxID=29760 RepID=A0A438CJL1_VITVI|nr:hypothetical protein CK203_098177 [Vitis vinifera]
MKMMVPQIVKLVGVQVMLHKKEMLISVVKGGGGTSGGNRGVGDTGEGTGGDGSTGRLC